MNPFIRTPLELNLMTQSKILNKNSFDKSDFKRTLNKNNQNKKDIVSRNKNKVNLPNLPNNTKFNWIKSKKALSRFIDELDYNNQIQSSYDLTLLARQTKRNDYDAA